MKHLPLALIAAVLFVTPVVAKPDARIQAWQRLERAVGWRVADACAQPPDGGVCPEGLCYNAACPSNAPCLRPGMAAKMKFCRAEQ
jgi:hypothetical protein